MEHFNAFLDVYGLVAIFVVLLAKAIGVPIPIPADIIILAVASRAADGRMVAWQTFLVCWLALVLGGVAQFVVIRTVGRKPLYRHGHRIGLTPNRLDAVAQNMSKGGPLGISLAVVTPGVRMLVVTGCSLAGMDTPTFALGFGLGTALLLCVHFFLGYVGLALLSMFGLPAAIAIAALGLSAYLGFRYFKRHSLISKEQ